KPYRFSLHSILKFGIQAIDILHVLHSKKVVHRDIKPGSFAIGNSQSNIGRFYLVDFGLCKKLNEHDGVIVKPQCKGCFRGSLTYASLNAHQQVELGRNDDLMSLLYILVEFYNGQLPWSECEDMDKIEKMKKFYCGQHLLKHHPRQFLEIESYILSLDYDIDPNYELLTSLLQQAALENEIDLNYPFEWEDDINYERKRIMMYYAHQNNKILKNVKSIDQEMMKIEINKKENYIEQIEKLESQKQQHLQTILTPYQLKVHLNIINIIHKLKRKYNRMYLEQDDNEPEKEEMQTKSQFGSLRKQQSFDSIDDSRLQKLTQAGLLIRRSSFDSTNDDSQKNITQYNPLVRRQSLDSSNESDQQIQTQHYPLIRGQSLDSQSSSLEGSLHSYTKLGSLKRRQSIRQSVHIHPVASYQPRFRSRANSRVSDTQSNIQDSQSLHSRQRSNSRSPFTSPHPSDKQLIQSSIQQQSSITKPHHKREDTVQQFKNVLDSLTGVGSEQFNSVFDVNEMRANDNNRDSYIEQYIDNMNSYDQNKPEIDWDQTKSSKANPVRPANQPPDVDSNAGRDD
ncbi:MAG: putative protein serine/threonine kinase, partial [Streblomastix strix]